MCFWTWPVIPLVPRPCSCPVAMCEDDRLNRGGERWEGLVGILSVSDDVAAVRRLIEICLCRSESVQMSIRTISLSAKTLKTLRTLKTPSFGLACHLRIAPREFDGILRTEHYHQNYTATLLSGEYPHQAGVEPVALSQYRAVISNGQYYLR